MDKANQARKLITSHGEISLPAFMPDATYGSVKNLSFQDVSNTGINEVVTTTLHLEQKFGSLNIKKLGGLHKFFGWDKPILTDSGGWQVFSLINAGNNSQNFITEVGCSFIDTINGKQTLLTPESSIQIQFNLDSDIMTVLDNPILGDSSLSERKECVRINTVWAKRAKTHFGKLLGSVGSSHPEKRLVERFEHNMTPVPHKVYRSNNIASQEREQLLGAVIQGANDFKLRKQSAEELIDIGFDIYNFGGIPMFSDLSWKIREQRNISMNFYHEMLEYVANLIPNDKVKYAMGVGQPTDIAFCVDVGWDLFDTVLPTRNARHGYLYVSEGQGEETKSYSFRERQEIRNKKQEGLEPLGHLHLGGSITDNRQPTTLSHDVLRLKSERYKLDDKPVDENCDCECCRTVSRAYLRHLIRIKESSGFRLATIHNLRFYSNWMESIRSCKV